MAGWQFGAAHLGAAALRRCAPLGKLDMRTRRHLPMRVCHSNFHMSRGGAKSTIIVAHLRDGQVKPDKHVWQRHLLFFSSNDGVLLERKRPGASRTPPLRSRLAPAAVRSVFPAQPLTADNDRSATHRRYTCSHETPSQQALVALGAYVFQGRRHRLRLGLQFRFCLQKAHPACSHFTRLL